MPEAKSFDIIRQGINSAIDIYSKNADADFREEHEVRQTIAKGIIKDRNNILYSDINNKLIENISNATHKINWSDQASVNDGRESIFGEDGLINSAKETFQAKFTPIPDTANEDLNDKLILFDRQNLISGDVFTEIERKEVEKRLFDNFSRGINSISASVPSFLNQVEEGNKDGIINVAVQALASIDSEVLLINDKVDLAPSEGANQGILRTAERLNPDTIQSYKAYTLQLIAVELVASGRYEDALDFVEQLEAEDSIEGAGVSGIASYVLEEGADKNKPITVSDSIRSVIEEAYGLDEENISKKSLETNVNISELNDLVINLNEYRGAIALNPELEEILNETESKILFMRDGINKEFERLNSVSRRLYGKTSSKVRKARNQFRNASFIKRLEGLNPTDVSTPSSGKGSPSPKSLQSHITDITKVSNSNNTDYKVLSVAIDSTVNGGGFTSDDFLHIQSILDLLNKDNKPMANSLYQYIKEQANKRTGFLYPEVDQENNKQANTLKNSRNVEDYLQKLDLKEEDDRPELTILRTFGTEVYPATLDAVIAEDFKLNSEGGYDSKSGRFVGTVSFAGRILRDEVHRVIDNNPELSTAQAYDKAKRSITDSPLLGPIVGTGGMDSSLAETLIVGVLIASGAPDIDPTGSSKSHEERINKLEIIPVSLEKNPQENTFRIWNSNKGSWEKDQDGNQIRFQFGETINNDLIKTSEDLESNLQAFDGINSVTGDLQLDQALRMTSYRGGRINPIDQLLEFTGKMISSYEQKYQQGKVALGYEHYSDDDDIAWLMSTSESGMLTPNMPGYFGETARLNLLLNPSPYDVEIIEETMGPDLAKKFLDTGTTFKHLLDVGIVRNDAQRIAYEYKKLYEEFAIRLSINSESGIDLNDFDGIYVLDLLTENNPQLNSMANKRLEEILANDPDQDFLPVRAFEVVQEAVQDTFDNSLDLLRSVLTEEAIIPESNMPTFSEYRDNIRESKEKNRPALKADQDLFNALLNQSSQIIYDRDSELTSVASALGRADQAEGKTVTIVKVKDSNRKTQSISIDDFKEKLILSESSGRTGASITIPDGRTFVGKLQFGKARLTDYKNETGEAFTQEEFRNDEALQDKVANWHFEDIDKRIKKLQKEDPGIFGKYTDLNGLRAVAHLGGFSNLKRFLKGESNTKDMLGTSLQDYYDKFADNNNNNINSVINSYEEIAKIVASGKSFTYDQSDDGKTVKITKVEDGDTFVVLKGMSYRVSTVTSTNSPEQDGSIPVEESVRFAHIDTPETAKYYKGQYADRGGREASRVNS